VHATLVQGGLTYLDNEQNASITAGVSIDNLKYKRIPVIGAESQGHEYYCESCSVRLYENEPIEAPNRYLDRIRIEHKKNFEQFESMEQKFMYIPESMSTMTLQDDQSVIRIRALGKGYHQAATCDISEDASNLKHLWPVWWDDIPAALSTRQVSVSSQARHVEKCTWSR